MDDETLTVWLILITAAAAAVAVSLAVYVLCAVLFSKIKTITESDSLCIK